MKKYILYITLGLIAASILILLVSEFSSDSLKKPAPNPYAFKVDQFKKIDPSLLKYRETKRLKLPRQQPVAIDYHKGILGISYQNSFQLIDTAGNEKLVINTEKPNTCFSFSPVGNIYIGNTDGISAFYPDGSLIRSIIINRENIHITSIVFDQNEFYAADAGNRLVYHYNETGNILDSINGRNKPERNYGFIIPSPYFDMVIDQEQQLWIVNPGLLKVENFTRDGSLRAFWGQPSFDIEGFTGCCNPVHIEILPDGSFVTSEKGLVRIKVYSAPGEFESVVAGPESFDEDSEPPDLAVDENGRIYILDISRKMVRIFERNIS